MRLTYELTLSESQATIITVKVQLPLFGRWTELVVTSYCLHEPHGVQTTAINFNFYPIPNSEVRGSSFDAVQDGKLALARGNAGNRQVFEQELFVPKIVGALLDYSDLNDGGVPAGRIVTDSILRRVESLVETVRQRLLSSLSSDPEVRMLALDRLDDRYGKPTADAISTFLGHIDWRLMLAKSGCDADQLNVVEFAMANNPPRFHSIREEPSRDIPLIAFARLGHFDSSTIADLKATALVKNVCGEELFAEFESRGRITVCEQGYTFVIRPGEFVDTTDPNGKTARLCIHTRSFACNPIDEIVIAFLHIRHKLSAYMAEAIVHGAEPGFIKKVA